MFMVDSDGQATPVDFSHGLSKEAVVDFSHGLSKKPVVDLKHGLSKKPVVELNSAEYAEFDGASISPRQVTVHFRIEATGAVNFQFTHASSKPEVEGNVYEVDMPMTVGGGGLNVVSFGDHKVVNSDVVKPDGTPLEGTVSKNDFRFYPWLRFDAKEGFLFVTTEGPSKTARCEADGAHDGGKRPLNVKILATIVEPKEEPEDE